MKSKEQKWAEAQQRNMYWAALSPKEQIAYLNKCGFAAIKQRAKIEKRSAK